MCTTCVCVSPSLFFLSQKYFPSLLTATLIGKDKRHRADKARKILVQEYFSSALRVPGLEGYLHLKDGYKSKWKKLYFILRASGLYHTIKGAKMVSSCIHLSICLFIYVQEHVYTAVESSKWQQINYTQSQSKEL